jgi:four helix bundle protein
MGAESYESSVATVPQTPKLLDQMRAALRVRHCSMRTEEAYVHWVCLVFDPQTLKTDNCKLQNPKLQTVEHSITLQHLGESMTPEELSDRLLDFAARIGKVVDALPDTRMGRHIAGQLVRCGTSPAANYEEGCAAESRADFIHKLKVVLKELRESRGWLRMIVKTELLPEHRLGELLDECSQLCNIIGKSLVTAIANRESQV